MLSRDWGKEGGEGSHLHTLSGENHMNVNQALSQALQDSPEPFKAFFIESKNQSNSSSSTGSKIIIRFL